MKRTISVILAVLMVLSVISGCDKKVATKSKSSKPNTSSVVSEQPDQIVSDISYKTQFTNMPESFSDMMNLYIAGDVAIFEFVNAGMDTYSSELTAYSLSEDKVLGNLSLDEGVYDISPFTNGGFVVTNLDDNTYVLYDRTCAKQSEGKLADSPVYLNFAVASDDGKYILTQSAADATHMIYNTETKKSVTLSIEQKWFNDAFCKNGRFYLVGGGAISINTDGSDAEILSETANAEYINNEYAIGMQASYIVLLSFNDLSQSMIEINDNNEINRDAFKNTVLSLSVVDGNTTLRFYNTTDMTVTEVSENGKVFAARLINDKQAVAIISSDDGSALKFKLINIDETSTTKDINKEDYNEDKINGIPELPEPEGSQEFVDLTNSIEEKYGVRILCGADIFDVESLGYTATPADEQSAYDAMLLLEDYFDYYPEGLLREAGLGKPLVIYLCDSLQPTAGGMNTYYKGYNATFITVGGHDDYLLGVLTHELGHALERGISPEVLSGWTEMMPDDALQAYGDGIEGISVEYTPDDKSGTEVWFYDVYGRSNQMEDRAVIFAGMRDSYLENDIGYFKYDGLKKKADYWSYMLRETYESCKNVKEFKWESALK